MADVWGMENPRSFSRTSQHCGTPMELRGYTGRIARFNSRMAALWGMENPRLFSRTSHYSHGIEGVYWHSSIAKFRSYIDDLLVQGYRLSRYTVYCGTTFSLRHDSYAEALFMLAGKEDWDNQVVHRTIRIYSIRSKELADERPHLNTIFPQTKLNSTTNLPRNVVTSTTL